MKHLISIPAVLAAVSSVGAQLLFSPSGSNFKLGDGSVSPDIKIAKNEPIGVPRTAQDLAWDFGRVLGQNGTVTVVDGETFEHDTEKPVIIAGTIGHSTLIDKLISDGKIDVSDVEGEWESYISKVVENPVDGLDWAFVIAGSDRRATIHALYDLSEQMGVSPWYWWADVPVKPKTGIWVSPDGKVQPTPSIHYRGFFINDEAPALSGWVGQNFKGVFNSAFYGRVFELCLRLKGNYIWPAMWGKMFYVDDAKNGQLAHDYGVFMGTSHHEPMARSEKEQQNFLEGDWDWGRNQDNIVDFFQDGIDRAENWDTIWTLGMRGSGDVASPTLTAADLEELIQVQQALLLDAFNTTEPLDIPQTWVLYKEVSEYYRAGMKVPDSVTLLWTDDNSGNIIRVPIANETDRAAGAGVYYHFDYVGAPRSYKWINTIQLVKTWEQMHLAYSKNARKIWIANVGDIKPLEIPLAHFMDMAYNMDRHTSPESTTAWIKRWAGQEFGSDVADATSDILNTYGILLVRRKYELLSELPFAFSTIHYDEALRHLAEWQDLLDKTQKIYDSLDETTKIAYFQLVLHPVLAGKVVVDLYTKTALNKLYYDQGRVSANTVAQEAHKLFAQDASITDRYHSLNGGKWNHFVNQAHIGYTSWNDPPNNQNIMPTLSYTGNSGLSEVFGVGIQGTSNSYPKTNNLMLLSVDPYLPSSDARYIDVFARKNTTFTYKISSNETYVTLSNSEGSLSAPGATSDTRSVITIDWDEAPLGLSYAALEVSGSDGSTASLLLPVNKTRVMATFSGYVESNGIVSIEAGHFSTAEEKNGVSYIEIPHYGRTISGVKPWPATIGSLVPAEAPELKYSFYTTTQSAKARLVVMLGPSHNHDPSRPLSYSYSIDGSSPITVRYVSTEPPYKEGRDWRKAVVEGGWTSTVQLETEIEGGVHELSLQLLEPGVVLQKVVVDLGGYKATALGPPESKKAFLAQIGVGLVNMFSNQNSRFLVTGLLCLLPLSGVVSGATIPRTDGVVPRSAIAVKLSAGDLRARSTLTGAELVESLVQKAQENTEHAKRDVKFSVLPLINSIPVEKVAELVQRATELDSTYEPVDFGSWYQVQFEPQAEERDPQITHLLENLAGNAEVTSCQRLAGAQVPAIQYQNDPLAAQQGYLGAAGTGINAKYAWGFPGGDGAGTTIIDIERGWQLNHEDLAAANITLVAGMNVKDRYGGNYPHGTSVLGEMLMVDNTIGGVGIIPKAKGHVVGIQRTVGGGPVENQPEAILDAASFLKFGDAMLLELQVTDINFDLWPVEIYDAEYDAIRLATALGITVIEPAGNGGMNLDGPVVRDGNPTPRALLNKNSPDFRDSGAIMVGAGSSAVPRTRLDFSNYGSRVDVHSWGENILTSSVNGAYEDIYSNFSGTSGAAPIIAGAALSIQGMIKANKGSKLSPAALRTLIKKGGTPSSNPSADKIGVQPNLRALIDGGHLK
ncbi:Intracellular serine protease [Paramyrothecium foliicola]|nr:Intracellular serine protease [Paramyrothecium foliicola]